MIKIQWLNVDNFLNSTRSNFIVLTIRPILGLIIGGLIITAAGWSLIDKIVNPTITMNEDFEIEIGEAMTFTIPGPSHSPQHMEILGDAFDLQLRSPGTGLQITNTTSYQNELTLDWIHLEDGETRIKIQNIGNNELEIKSITVQTPNPFGFTIDLMVLTTGIVVIGFSLGFTIRKTKGF